MKILICGTQTRKGVYEYRGQVWDWLDKNLSEGDFVIEGCCEKSADAYAEEWIRGTKKKLMIKHFPATKGNYLKRNIDMVESCDKVVAFWNGFSYGTAHTIAQAVLRKKPVEVILL